jgi:pimeloyl-ACP methyl ester carboxylesterase
MIKRPDRVQLLSGLQFPIQWLIGKEDTIASPDKVLQQSTYANVNFVEVYANCAHMGMQEQPSILVRDIVMFAMYCSRLI